MENGRIPKDCCMVNWRQGTETIKGRPKLRYKDACKRNMKALNWTLSLELPDRQQSSLENRTAIKPQKGGTRPGRSVLVIKCQLMTLVLPVPTAHIYGLILLWGNNGY